MSDNPPCTPCDATLEDESEVPMFTSVPPVPEHLADRRIHPALHIEEGLATIGVMEQDSDGGLKYRIVTSDRQEYPLEVLLPILTTGVFSHPGILDRWPAEDIADWLSGQGPAISFAKTADVILGLFTKYLDTTSTTATILAMWTMATYFHPMFPAFARLFLTGEKGSGKSKAQLIVAGLAWNGMYRIIPTGPVLYRLIEALRPTYCVSEADNLDKEQRHVLQAVINEGYLRSGMVDRYIRGRVHTFAVYGPLTLGSITGLEGVTEDRTIPLIMTRGLNKDKINADVDPADSDFRAARGLLYRLTLERFHDVAKISQTLPDPPWLVGRERQLWRPLLIMAHLVDVNGTLDLGKIIVAAAKEQTNDRRHPSEEVEALVSILDGMLQEANEILVRPGELIDDLKVKFGWKNVTAAKVGHLLLRNGFKKPAPPRDRDTRGVIYLVTRTQVESILERYQTDDTTIK